ncbi:NAD-dependent succinate-semialdehyde dehydrogenase [Antarcticimicrobium luteum]|uniref:NAD-dependent succinate-semialdehyde dehydrogenase n=2 Tax=Antarcticimicrobium luteum TaxID=2547397 RepID=A0A4R5V1X1_9RHOB|nr:NAD-dependent succinate-semialdehyde dehydrogenase [Antarcticimicrobium luteum]
MHIAGQWIGADQRDSLAVHNPATGEEIGRLPCATPEDVEAAARAAARGFAAWKAVSPFDRAKVLHRAAALLRERADTIAPILTREQGKPLAQSRLEVITSAEIIEWFAEEGRRTYGRVIPARAPQVRQMVVKDPVGPVAAFTPWNFPIGQAVRKLSAALCTGCSIVLKGAETTPGSVIELVRAYLDAGVPAEVIGLISGDPVAISARLIAHPEIRKVSFTGSTAVGRHLAELAGRHMKRSTMELGGHAPVLIFDDADAADAVDRMAAAKFRNAGQICIAPTRFLVQEPLFDTVAAEMVARAEALRLGDGMNPGTDMGPLAHERRVVEIEALVGDALDKGARLLAGGKRRGNSGCFFEPTVLADVPPEARMMQDEPFGPVVILNCFAEDDTAFAEANRLPYGLAAYGFTASAARADRMMSEIESGMVSINHQGLALIETPFGGIKDSGYGHEGGFEALDAYLNTRFLTHRS